MREEVRNTSCWKKKSMLLTDGLKATGNSFLAAVDKTEGKEMGSRFLQGE